MMDLGNFLIYQTEKGDTKIDVFFQNSNIWMNQSAIATLYNTTPQNITMHIRNIYAGGELDELSTCKEFLQVQTEGERQINQKYICQMKRKLLLLIHQLLPLCLLIY